uniref:CBS domain-containing protein n=2 Tax=Glycine subgen. Soja TaxID=1462606 RepID=A0A0R0LGV1_SOYBN
MMKMRHCVLNTQQLDSLPDVTDQEVTGIITMEDVMEKLLQFSTTVHPITSVVFLISLLIFSISMLIAIYFFVRKGDILDETDEYVHVQKNIRINL